MEQALVWWSKQTSSRYLSLLDSNILGSLLCWKNSLVGGLDVNKVNLHLSLGLDTNDEWRTLTGGNDLFWVVDRLEEETESALQLLDDCLGKGGEVNGWVFIVDVFGKLCDGLSVGLGLEAESLGLEESSQFLVVGDDTVVDNSKLPLWVRSGAGSVLSLIHI